MTGPPLDAIPEVARETSIPIDRYAELKVGSGAAFPEVW